MPFLIGIIESNMPPIVTDVSVAWSVCLSGRLSHYHTCTSAEAIGWNEMPFGSDTCVVPSNIVLDRSRSPT